MLSVYERELLSVDRAVVKDYVFRRMDVCVHVLSCLHLGGYGQGVSLCGCQGKGASWMLLLVLVEGSVCWQPLPLTRLPPFLS